MTACAAKKVRVRDLRSGREYDESYDKLILAPGAAPIRPPLPGIDLPGIHTLRNLQDTDQIKARMVEGASGRRWSWAGFIGLEMVENLVERRHCHDARRNARSRCCRRSIRKNDDFQPILELLTAPHGVTVLLNDSAAAFEAATDGPGLVVRLQSGGQLPAQLVILGVGVRPGEQAGGRCRT